jgi:peroxiredoxin Q/BCP
MITVGDAAPDFSMLNQDDQAVTLAQLAGSWVVLYFYPKDDTPGCTIEACEFTDSIKDFQGLDAKVIGVSPDNTASHRKFIEKHKLSITLLSDPEKKALKDYGAWGTKVMYGKESEGVIRSTVIIAPDGKIAHHWPKVTAKGHAVEVRDKLSALKAEWKPKAAK